MSQFALRLRSERLLTTLSQSRNSVNYCKGSVPGRRYIPGLRASLGVLGMRKAGSPQIQVCVQPHHRPSTLSLPTHPHLTIPISTYTYTSAGLPARNYLCLKTNRYLFTRTSGEVSIQRLLQWVEEDTIEVDDDTFDLLQHIANLQNPVVSRWKSPFIRTRCEQLDA